MHLHRQLISLEELLEEDLQAICEDLSSEFSDMSGGRLLVTGGGGFLGYYLVQSALHWNAAHPRGGRSRPGGAAAGHRRRRAGRAGPRPG